MTHNSHKPLSLWFLLTNLYITQYLGMGFLMVTLMSVLRSQGVALATLAWIYLLALPWAFKFLWSPWVDALYSKRLGHYRGWLLLTQALMVSVLVTAAFFPPSGSLKIIFALFFAYVIFSATQDIATDALACTLFPPNERGLLNGIQTAGGLMGNIIGGGLMLMLHPYLGWAGCLMLMAAMIAAAWLQLLFFREPESVQAACTHTRLHFSRLWVFWRGKGLWAAMIACYALPICLGYGILTPMLVDAGWAMPQIGMVLNVFGSVVGILAALVAGWLIRRLGRQQCLRAFALWQCLGIPALLLPAFGYTDTRSVYFAVTACFLVYPPLVAILSTLMMDKAAHSGTPASDYAVQFCLYMMAALIASALTLPLAAHVGYAGVAILCIASSLLSLGLSLWLPLRHSEAMIADDKQA